MKDRTKPVTAPTMRHVAERAGVSPATVSLVLRGNTTISEQTRNRVLQAQRDLGYTVNRFAQQFVRRTRRSAEKQKPDQLAYCLIGTTFDNVAYAPFLHGIVKECQASHLHLVTQTLDEYENGEFDVDPLLRNGTVDGLIVTGRISEAGIASLRRRTRLPFVVLGNYWLNSPVPRVELDLARVGAIVAEKVVEHGHRRIAVAVEHVHNAYEAECLRGMQARLVRQGLGIPPTHIISTEVSYSPAPAFVDPLLRIKPLPTALITTDVRVADECIAELRARQVSVPEQIEVFTLAVSANERRSPLCRAFSLGLERCGHMAVRRLVELVESPNTEPTATVLEPGEWLEVGTRGNSGRALETVATEAVA